jgi:hypothetical protein
MDTCTDLARRELPELLKPGEVEHALKVTRDTLAAWAAQGRLERVRFGPTTIRYTRTSVLRLLDESAATRAENDPSPARPPGSGYDEADDTGQSSRA